MLWITLVSVAAAVLLLIVTITLFVNMRWLYSKLTFRHLSIAMLLAGNLSRNRDLLYRIKMLQEKDLPEFIEEFREMIGKNEDTRAALPQDSKEDGEFILYLALRALMTGVGREELLKKTAETLYLSPAVLKAISKRG